MAILQKLFGNSVGKFVNSLGIVQEIFGNFFGDSLGSHWDFLANPSTEFFTHSDWMGR